MLRYSIVILLGIFSVGVLPAQQLPVNLENISDQQLLQLISQYQLSGLSESELEARAREKGLSTDQILMLKKRMAILDPGGMGVPTNAAYNNKTDAYTERNRILTRGPSIKKRDSTGNTLYMFGEEMFDNLDLSFEPNPHVTSPPNYVIGINDQLVVDVFGLSENTKKLKVSTEGTIRFPNLGPIRVAGLTLEQATEKITRSLTANYPAIASGKTRVAVSLGQIRSIRVTVIGEVFRPGNYTMSSLSTLMHALYACGGPSGIGTMREVALIRAGKKVVELDVYDFLMKGDLSKNQLLQDDDVIKVSPFQVRVGIRGAVKRPAMFDLRAGDHASVLLNYAGGFTDKAMKSFVRVKRWGSANREVLTVPFSQLDKFELLSGDTLYVDSLVKWFTNRVVISGAVNYPGEFGLNEVNQLSKLLQLAQPNEMALLDRAMIIRKQEDFTPSYIPFSIKEVLAGSFNINLQREDSVHIFKIDELREVYTLKINGEVNRPDTYNYAAGMRIQDLILLAGGLKDGASLQRIEVSRRLRKANSVTDTAVYAVIKSIDLQKGIGIQSNELDFILEPFDIVSIRKSPTYKEQITVSIEGEVMYPGTYTLSGNRERLTDIIKRAGGLKQAAYAPGAILVRKTYLGTSQADAAIFNNKLSLVNSQGRGGAPVLSTTDTAQLRATLDNISAQQKPVAIRLDQALQLPGSMEDLFLEEGDVLKVPKQVQTVQTFGAVNVPQQLAFREGMTVRNLIHESGGFALSAARKKLYVVNPNGTVAATRRFLFFKSYPSLQPGSEIYVPARRDTRRLTPAEIIGLGTGLISMGGLVIALLNTAR
jgi:protein involved in polysaccharide export with SLBB domain